MLKPDLSQIEGLIFDMDGVLIDSSPCHDEAFRAVFGTLGINSFRYPEWAGRRTPDVIRDVLTANGHAVDPDLTAKLAAEKTRLALQCLEETRPVSPGCEAALANAASRVPIGLASSGSAASVAAFLRTTGSASLFSSVLSGGDVAEAKPSPEIYNASAARLGLPPERCAVIEDAVSGVQSARAAGMGAVIGIPGTSTAGALLEAGADFLIGGLGEIKNWKLASAKPIAPSDWTAVVPAAGRGSRLGFDRPKILYPVGGRLILDWLLDYLVPFCAHLIFVLSPEGRDDVASELERRIPGRFEIVLQESPTGMGDAVKLALPRVRTPHMALVWGDQVALRRSSVETCLMLHQGALAPDVTVPTVVRKSPYIHFDRDNAGRINAVRQAREGAPMPETGESDTGFFCFHPEKLAVWLEEMAATGEARGALTGEFNLLPVIARAATRGVVLTPRVITFEETVGINNSRDAAIAEAFLRRTNGDHS